MFFRRIQKRPLFRAAFSDIWLREPDLNRRPSGYEPDELPDCSIPRLCGGILQSNAGVSTVNDPFGRNNLQSVDLPHRFQPGSGDPGFLSVSQWAMSVAALLGSRLPAIASWAFQGSRLVVGKRGLVAVREHGVLNNKEESEHAQKRPLFRVAFFDVWLREPDLNRRPSGYEPDELPDCSIPRLCVGILQVNVGLSNLN